MVNNEDELYDAIYGDLNERFVGDELDESKLVRIERIRDYCKMIEKMDYTISAPLTQCGKKSRNWTASLAFPGVTFLSDRKLLFVLSELVKQSDDMAIATVGETIKITFGVHEMWSRYHYE